MRNLRIFTLLITLATQYLNAQNCVADYFYKNYKGEYEQKIKKTIITAQNELLSIGAVFYFRNGTSFEDGWITKMTPQGSIIWSKRYNGLGHNVIHFTDIIASTDSTYFVVGTVSYVVPLDTTQYSKEIWGIIMHIDKQGRLLWSNKMSSHFDPQLYHTGIQSISKTKNGDFILTGVVRGGITGFQSSLIVIRMDIYGKAKWVSTVSSANFVFDFGLTKSLQLSNNNILLAGMIDQRASQGFNIPKVGYYFLTLDDATGAKIWSNCYLFIDTSSTYFATSETLQNIQEHSNGDLSFLAYTTTWSFNSNPPYGTKTVNIVIDAFGQLKKAISYTNLQPGTYPMAALTTNNGENLMLIDDQANAQLIRLTNTGAILWNKAYSTGPTLTPASLGFTSEGYYIFLNDRGPYGGNTFLMKVDSTASIDCKTASPQLTETDVTSIFVPENPGIYITVSETDYFLSIGTISFDYVLQSSTDCIKACCQDIIDTVVRTSICEGDKSVLPDSYIVKDSGTYYISYKTAKGCDSVAFYHFSLIKNPFSLRIKGNECFEHKDTIILTATPGFDNYNWLNNFITDSSYVATKPGIYWVSVSNSCGTKKDSIEIFGQCEFPIYLPTAFTPNGDGLNDIFRIPPSNKNNLERLVIYDRWGQKIFETKDKGRGWDGTFKGKLQPVGVYIYFLIMESLDGKKITKKGLVTLAH